MIALAEDELLRGEVAALRILLEKLEQRIEKSFDSLQDSIAGVHWVKALERRIEALEEALEKRTTHLEQVFDSRIGKIESTFSRLVWLVITPVVLGLLALVFKASL